MNNSLTVSVCTGRFLFEMKSFFIKISKYLYGINAAQIYEEPLVGDIESPFHRERERALKLKFNPTLLFIPVLLVN